MTGCDQTNEQTGAAAMALACCLSEALRQYEVIRRELEGLHVEVDQIAATEIDHGRYRPASCPPRAKGRRHDGSHDPRNAEKNP